MFVSDCFSSNAARKRASWRMRLSSVLALLLSTGTAVACEHYTGVPDVLLETAYTASPDAPHVLMEEKSGRSALRYCTFPGGDIPVFVRLDIPGLTYAGDIQYQGRTYASYATAGDSALFAFDIYSKLSDRRPLRLGEELEFQYETFRGDAIQELILHNVLVFSRGGRMRTSSIRTGLLTLRSPAYPGIDSSHAYYLAPRFPVVTCPLQDVSETLQDVKLAELPSPGSTAKEKPVAVRLNCGADAPRAQVTLTDAGDATNSGSLLTPSADSTAKGVRVQLLQSGREVQFGRIWDFEPGVGGAQDITFTARYMRTDEPLKPGLIKGEAVLNVDYW